MRNAAILLVTVVLMVFIASAGPVLAKGVSAQIEGTPKINNFVANWIGSIIPGTQIKVEIKVKNTGDQSYNFWVGLSFMDSQGGIYDVQPVSIYLETHWYRGDTETVKFVWTVPIEMPSGSLSMTSAVWEDFDGYYMSELLDRWGWFEIGTVLEL